MKRAALASSLIIALSLAGCFTGVESTPKITYADVKKEKIVETPEQKFLTDVAMESPSQWQQGKKFYVADPKVSIVFTAPNDLNDIAGKDISFHSYYPVTSVSGEEITEIEFVTPEGKSIYYRANIPYSEMASRAALEVPFTIEESIIEQVRSQIEGRSYYVVTPLWYDAEGEHAVNGLRHVPVNIVDVKPGNAVYPIRVVFEQPGDTLQYSMYMTVGSQRTSTRNFHTLFAFDNPRVKYPRISDEMWALIIHSKIKEGMTREECRLALGAPQTIGQRPSTAGMVEYWSYANGIYLLFDEGYLSYFRK